MKSFFVLAAFIVSLNIGLASCKPQIQNSQAQHVVSNTIEFPDTAALPRVELPIGSRVIMRTKFPKKWKPEAFDEVDGKQVAQNPHDQALYDGSSEIIQYLSPVGKPVYMPLDTGLVSRFRRPFFDIDSVMYPSVYYRHEGRTFVLYVEAGKYRDSVPSEMVAYLDYAYLLGFDGDRYVNRQLIYFNERKLYEGHALYFFLDSANHLFTKEIDAGEICGFIGQHHKSWDHEANRWLDVPWKTPKKE